MNLSLYRFSFFLLFATLFFSCTKIVTTDIGSGLIPPVDGVTTKDTVLDVFTKNSGFDTVSVGISDNHALGYVNDPVFGTTKASVNFQVEPPTTPLSFGFPRDSIVLDSVVLCLSYKSAWGDTLSSLPLKLHVYTMDPEEVFKIDSSYNNLKIFEKSQEITLFKTAKVVDISALNDIDTTAYYKEVATNQVRIQLNNSFGQQLIDYDSATVYQSDSTFNNYLRGLIVEPDETGQALIYVNLIDTATHLSLYYHTKDLKDTATKRFSPSVLSSASSNTILRNYQASPIPSYVASADTNQDLVFMQTTPGTYATLRIPGVERLSNRIIHRAEILMYQVPDANEQFLTPPNLFLAAYSSDSMRRIAIPYDISFQSDGSISNLAAFGVLPKHKSGSSEAYYSFDITRYVQSIVTKQNKLHNLILFAPYNQYIYPSETIIYPVLISSPGLNSVATGRVLLGGGNNSQYKMRLHIVYSLL